MNYELFSYLCTRFPVGRWQEKRDLLCLRAIDKTIL